jgi:hypothetical protein
MEGWAALNIAPMEIESLLALIKKTNRVLVKNEDAAIAVMHSAIDDATDRLELELRRAYPEDQGTILIAAPDPSDEPGRCVVN